MASENPIKYLSRQHSLECIAALITIAGFLGVLQTFIIGQHFLIPTMILFVVILFGNLAWHGFNGARWAKFFLFWGTTLLSFHGFFALFWAKKYREVLGGSFEIICASIVIVLAYLLYEYAKRNQLFTQGEDQTP